MLERSFLWLRCISLHGWTIAESASPLWYNLLCFQHFTITNSAAVNYLRCTLLCMYGVIFAVLIFIRVCALAILVDVSLLCERKALLEEEMATHSSILARDSMDSRNWWAPVRGSQRVGHDWLLSVGRFCALRERPRHPGHSPQAPPNHPDAPPTSGDRGTVLNVYFWSLVFFCIFLPLLYMCIFISSMA